jgi:hypothetical protein
MNINNLEKLARQTIKGEKTERTTMLTPAEHRSLKSLSWQIATNLKAETGSGTVALVRPNVLWQ